jgi:hypothetical protein
MNARAEIDGIHGAPSRDCSQGSSSVLQDLQDTLGILALDNLLI